jgi:hypothetical protein
VLALLLAVVLYRDHVGDVRRPAWVRLKGAHVMSRDTLKLAGIKSNWFEFLRVMTSEDGVKERQVQRHTAAELRKIKKEKKHMKKFRNFNKS